jgi:hypothetical protein
MATEDCENSPSQVVVRYICHPKASSDWIQPTFVGKDIAESPPIKSEEVLNGTAIQTRENLACNRWAAKGSGWDVSSASNGYTIYN